MADLPLFICDVDGVISVNGTRKTRKQGTEGLDMFSADWHNPEMFTVEHADPLPASVGFQVDSETWMEPDGYMFKWSSELINLIRDLIDQKVIEFKWLSNWRHHAVNRLNPLFGFPETVTYIPWEKHPHDHDHELKAVALAQFLNLPANLNRRVVWVDDKAIRQVTDGRFDPNRFGVRDMLLLQPDQAYGITRPEWDLIETFLNQH